MIDADTRKFVGMHSGGFGNKNSFQYLDALIKASRGFHDQTRWPRSTSCS